MRVLLASLVLLFTLQSGGYRADIDAFRANRFEEISNPTGWSALVGLHWLSDGEFVVGADPISGIRLTGPSAPGRLGTVTVSGERIHFRVSTGLDAFMNGTQVYEYDMQVGGERTYLRVGGLTMALIRRGPRFALRVWDSKAPNRVALLAPGAGLKWMPVDPTWRIAAKFVPHPASQPRMKIVNVIGETVEMQNPGEAVFTVNGTEYHLEALLESDGADELFFIFKDATSGATTYGAGRYLYTPMPKDGIVDLDFNKAKNPPCAFTSFATCPLPPAKNRLTLAVRAGELDHVH